MRQRILIPNGDFAKVKEKVLLARSVFGAIE